MRADRIFGLVMIVLALGYLLSATQIQSSFLSDPVGPRVFPYIISVGVIIASVFLVLRPDPNADWPGMAAALQLGFALLVLIGYAMTIRPMGFLIPTAFAAGILSYQINQRPLPALASGLGLSIGLFVLFKLVLGLGLQGFPRGWF